MSDIVHADNSGNLKKNFFPLITVITIAYNAVSCLERTILSVVNQKYENIEYIVIDGGSIDGTLDILKQYNNVIDLWISEKDAGIYDAMNKGCRKASGDFVIFMNAGDAFFLNTSLQDMISQCPNCLNYSVIYGDVFILNSRKSDGHRISRPIKNIIDGMVSCHQSMLFKRKVMIDNPYNLELSSDFENILRLYKNKHQFFQVKNVIVSYFFAGGISDTQRVKNLINDLKILIKHDLLNIKTIFKFIPKFIMAIISDVIFLCKK